MSSGGANAWTNYCKDIASGCDAGIILDHAGKVLANEGQKGFSDAEAKSIAQIMTAQTIRVDSIKFCDVKYPFQVVADGCVRLLGGPYAVTLIKTNYVILIGVSKSKEKDEANAVAAVAVKVKDEGY